MTFDEYVQELEKSERRLRFWSWLSRIRGDHLNAEEEGAELMQFLGDVSRSLAPEEQRKPRPT